MSSKKQFSATAQEGAATVYTSYVEQGTLKEVFYNPIQVFNRDLSLLALSAFAATLRDERAEQYKGMKVCDALAASGLRTVRLMKELGREVAEVVSNDISEAAIEVMQENFKLNELGLEKIKISKQDANKLLAERAAQPFDVIDLDPFGSAVPFLENAVASIGAGGLLCVTCTDTRVTCGPDLQKCFYYYGSMRAKVMGIQENALRVVLSTISSAASRACKFIEPLFCIQAQFYLRVFVRVHRSRSQCGKSGLKVGNIFACPDCGNFKSRPYFTRKAKKEKLVALPLELDSGQCEVCKGRMLLNGPVWLDSLNSPKFMELMLQQLANEKSTLQLKSGKQLSGLLRTALQQACLSHVPLPLSIQKMSKVIHSSTPSFKVVEALLHQKGHRILPSYIHEGLYKSTASAAQIYRVLAALKRKQLGDKWLDNIGEKEPGRVIVKLGEGEQLDWEYKVPQQQKAKFYPHFFPHEAKHMGPKGRPEMKRLTEEELQALPRKLHKP